jgi:hypothetical protein
VSLVPLFGNIADIGIKPTSSFATRPWLLIGDAACKPIANRSFTHPKAARYFFEREALLAQFDELVIAI